MMEAQVLVKAGTVMLVFETAEPQALLDRVLC